VPENGGVTATYKNVSFEFETCRRTNLTWKAIGFW
jgi:hypothetical protein